MTLFIDDDYSWLSLMLRPECERRGIPLETSDLNTRGFGDLLFVTDAGTYSGEVKGAAEILGNISHCEAQLQKQFASADRCFLVVYGKVEAAEDGGSYAMVDPSLGIVHYTHGADSGISRTYKRRAFRTNYLGYRTWLARLVSLGVDVYEVPSREALATQLIGIYNVLTTEGDTLRRIIVEKPVVAAIEPAKVQFLRSVIGLDGARFGEEFATALWDGGYTSIAELVHALSLGHTHMQDLPLAKSNKRLGPAAVKRLKEALGL